MVQQPSLDKPSEKLSLLLQENRRLEMVLDRQRRAGKLCCLHCGSPELHHEGSFYSEGTRRNVWKCLACTQVQLERHLPEDEVRVLEHANPYYQPPTSTGIDERIREHSFILTLIQQYRTGSNLLEIGCSMGYKLAAARNAGWDVQGVELSSHAVEFAVHQLGLSVHHGTLESFLSAARYDVVVAWHVLEHVPSISSFLSHVYSYLSEGGFFFVQVPSYSYARDLVPWDEHPEVFTPVHNWYFTVESLYRRLLEHNLVACDVIEDTHYHYLTVVSRRLLDETPF